jgi:creatinine amidohydrolase
MSGTERPILFNELTRDDLREIARNGLAVLPVGATEQHGPHLPAGTDALVVEHLARCAAGLVAGEISLTVCPTLPFGSSHHHLAFGGTLSLGTETYLAVLRDLVESLIADGFHRVLIVNGHGGNHEIMQLVVRDLALKHQVSLGAVSYWQPAQLKLNELYGDAPGPPPPGHAGAFETSLILALRPELVRTNLPHRDPSEIADLPARASGWRLERNQFWLAIDGYTDSPDRADADLGRLYLQAAAETLAQVMTEFARAGN